MRYVQDKQTRSNGVSRWYFELKKPVGNKETMRVNAKKVFFANS